MEKRKLLLVAVSVGVFLVIVLSAAILIFTPTGTGMAAVFSPSPARPAAVPAGNIRGPASADAADLARNPAGIQGLIASPAGVSPSPGVSTGAVTPIGQEIAVVREGASPPPAGNSGASAPAGNSGAPAPAGNSSAPAPAGNSGASAPAGSAQRVISVPKPAAPAPVVSETRAAAQQTIPERPAVPVPERQAAPPPAAPAVPAAVPAKSPAFPAENSAPSGNSTASSPVRAAAVPAASRASGTAARTTPQPVRDYWIQTGAFSALIRAEDAKESLANKGLSSIIDDREVDGRIWYRVRVGPYTSENEASYWLALVKAIDGFGESQVRSTQR